MLFESGRAVFIKNSKIYLRKISMGFGGKSHTLTHFVAFEEHIADKTISKYLANGVVHEPSQFSAFT